MATSASPVPRTASGLALMAAGGLALLSLLGLMNRPSERQEEAHTERVASFTVERRAKEPERKPRPQRRRQAPKSRPRAAVPSAPRVGNALSSLSLGLDTGGLVDMNDVDRSLLGDTDDVAMTEDTVDTPPVALERTPPEIPLRLRKKGVTGQVLLNVLIDTDGRVKKVKVLSSSPPGVFDDIAIENAKTWRFRPGSNQGKPYAVWMNAPVDFRYD